jgi:hypothetical protein
MFNSLFDKLRELIGRKKDPTPTPPPPPRPAPTPGAIDYLKAWRLLKDIPFQHLGRVVSASAVIVFFAISGLLAWVFVFVRFFIGLS